MELDEARMNKFAIFLRRKNIAKALFKLKDEPMSYSDLKKILKYESTTNFFVNEATQFGIIRKEVGLEKLGDERYVYALTLMGLEIVKHLEEIHFIICRAGDRVIGDDGNDKVPEEHNAFLLREKTQDGK